MDNPDHAGGFPASMTTAPLAVVFQEVRHFRPDDRLHVEPIAVRAAELDWTIPAHRHEALQQFHNLARGRTDLLLDGTPHTVLAAALLRVAPGCVHAFRYEPGSVGQQLTVPAARLEPALADAPALAALLPRVQLLQGESTWQESSRRQP
jgi:AraC family transcriptional activator of pobA